MPSAQGRVLSAIYTEPQLSLTTQLRGHAYPQGSHRFNEAPVRNDTHRSPCRGRGDFRRNPLPLFFYEQLHVRSRIGSRRRHYCLDTAIKK